ncbi:hypothetical protein ACO2JO_19140 [Leptospira interrogans]
MMKHSPIFFWVATASCVVIGVGAGLGLDTHLHFRNADATTSTAELSKALAPEPFKMVHINQMSPGILALNPDSVQRPLDMPAAIRCGGASSPTCENDHDDNPIAARNSDFQPPVPGRKYRTTITGGLI